MTQLAREYRTDLSERQTGSIRHESTEWFSQLTVNFALCMRFHSSPRTGRQTDRTLWMRETRAAAPVGLRADYKVAMQCRQPLAFAAVLASPAML
jgi:hypothetical protein